ncbi:PSP1 domain-containing protein [Carboxydothermus pertinax]|uniref:Stage 0 sporulation protein n=1 Tax=Carboxydothermus pertinax TaxID=870242 RepID=A0A1L8CVL1_9THEO|nr:stage 0 sporulation family protein [Carboxydothermus pertinax]GAV22937.1 stage 0 sporulation protein [Carboxydothermus pertinax]
MQKVVGIRFKRAGKIYYFDPLDINFEPGDGAIVETIRGVEYGEVIIPPKYVSEEELVLPLKPVIRKATPEDLEILRENKEKEKKAFSICLEKIAQHGLPMKLVGVEYTFDRNKVIFYFTADGRIDFRELVRDLAAVFKTRIELRQIGVRDEAKMIGGLGCCGRELCCASWLSEFAPVSIKMAKEQNLTLNPTKISGICGRLMCCLKYESDTYEQVKDDYPEVGETVLTPMGEGKVTGVNIFRKTVYVELKELKHVKEFPAEEVVAKEEVQEGEEFEQSYNPS